LFFFFLKNQFVQVGFSFVDLFLRDGVSLCCLASAELLCSSDLPASASGIYHTQFLTFAVFYTLVYILAFSFLYTFEFRLF
jgi:hypothetical protein